MVAYCRRSRTERRGLRQKAKRARRAHQMSPNIKKQTKAVMTGRYRPLRHPQARLHLRRLHHRPKSQRQMIVVWKNQTKKTATIEELGARLFHLLSGGNE